MQVLTTSLFDDEIEIVIGGATSDDRARMTVMPAMYQDTIEAMVDGETDGRGDGSLPTATPPSLP